MTKGEEPQNSPSAENESPRHFVALPPFARGAFLRRGPVLIHCRAPSFASPLWDGGGALLHCRVLVLRQPPLPKGGGPANAGGGILPPNSAFIA